MTGSAAWAQDISLDPGIAPDVAVSHDALSDRDLIVGLGLGVNPDYEGSDDYRLVPLWQFRADDLYAENTFVQLFATQFRSNFLPHENWRLGLSAQFQPERDDVDSDAVDDLDNGSESLLFGVVLGYEVPVAPVGLAGVELNARQDVLNSNGYLVTGSLNVRRPLTEQLGIAGSLSTTFASSSYMENYFGIDEDDAERSGLDEFDADSGFKDAGLRLGLDYRFTAAWSASLIGQYKRLLDDAEDSPVTDDEGSANQFFTGVLVNFAF